MISLHPRLDGQHVSLEPLRPEHAPGLARAAAADRSLYHWSPTPDGEAEAAAYIEAAAALREAGTAAPFAVIRTGDGQVVGSTRFWNLTWWPWPPGHQEHGRDAPDTGEIGWTWLTRSAIRSAVNTEMKLLMLGHAFQTWRVHSICFHTDVRNERSRRALERLGARYEGVLRAHRMATDGGIRDSARFSVTASEWPYVQSRLQRLLARGGLAETAASTAAR